MPNTMAITPRTQPERLRVARRRLLEGGQLDSGLLDAGLLSSWQRSRDHGLVPDARTPGAPHASGAQLARALERRHGLVAHALPVMEFLCEQIRDSGSIVLLADPQGMLLHSLGDTGFADKAARVALRPGANWHEKWRGTNAVGTAITDEAACVVHGAEHYLERNAFLTCAASPVLDSCGQLLGVLDISGHRRGYNRHTLGLVLLASRMLEHQLFLTCHRGALQLRLHAHLEGLGTATEGLVAISEEGRILGASPVALAMLGLDAHEIGCVLIADVLATELSPLFEARGPRAVTLPNGRVLWLHLDGARAATSFVVPAAPTQPSDTLAALDTGDRALKAAIDRVRRVLDKPIALLLQGESGVGKELFARACHTSGPRHAKPFVAVNCAALPESLIESELFGYRPGAFTGAVRDGAVGRIREADGGTLFLDEIGDMPLALQARLLRVLQEREVVPLGGGKPVAVDFQLVCATHHRLRAEVAAGRFREDLYYRINGMVVQLPALRERSDLGALVAALLPQTARGCDLQLAPDVMNVFARFRWPGNLRQLSSVLRTACALLSDDERVISWQHLPDDMLEELSAPVQERAVADEAVGLRCQVERSVRSAINSCQGNVSEAARQLGISRNTLYRKLRDLGERQF